MSDDFLKGLFKEGSRISGNRKRYVLKELDGENLLETVEETYLDQDGPRTESTSAVHLLDCGHLMGKTIHEFGGACQICHRTACYRCIYTCDSCNRRLCARHVRKVGPGIYLCRRCRFRGFAKKVFLILTLGIHTFLSKEVTDEKEPKNGPAGGFPDQADREGQAGG